MTRGLLRLPRLGETMEQGTVVSWLVGAGESFARGDAVLEVETDKTVVEVPALGPGTLAEILAGEGAQVEIGAELAWIELGDGPDWTRDTDDDVPEAPGTRETTGTPAVSETAGAVRQPTAPEASDDADAETSAPSTATRPSGDVLRATPVARRLARRAGIGLDDLHGTGRRGRIEARDVDAAIGTRGPAVVRGGTLASRTSGPEDGAAMLFLHGFGADSTAWSALTSALARAGRRSVAVDLPGHGATEVEAARPEDLSAGLDAFVARTFGAAPLHVVAHSMGAIPAVALAARHPVASLTLIAPAGLGLSIDTAFVAGLARPGSVAQLVHVLRRMTAGKLPLSQTAIAEIHIGLARGRLTALSDALAGPAGQQVDIRDDLAALAARMPVRLLLGHRDRIIDWRECLDVGPRIAVHHFPQAGHMVHWEDLAGVAALLAVVTEAAGAGAGAQARV